MSTEKRHHSLDLRPEMGFHGMKDLVTIQYLREHCEFLASCVHEAAWAPRGAAYLGRRSVRGRRYLGLERKDGARLVHPEVQYERAMFQRWSRSASIPESGWHRILDYQVPVSDRKPSLLGLRAIDLLAVDAQGLPVVIELKIVRGPKGADSPLRAILEAAAYACVIQSDWPAFRSEMEGVLPTSGEVPSSPPQLDQVSLVVAAPPEYWAFWNNEARDSIVNARPAFRTLLEAFRKEGFPMHFTTIEGPVDTPDQLRASKAPFLDV